MPIVIFGPLALLIFGVAVANGRKPFLEALIIPVMSAMALWLAALVVLFVKDGQWRFALFGHVVSRYWWPMLLLSSAVATLGIGLRRLILLLGR